MKSALLSFFVVSLLLVVAVPHALAASSPSDLDLEIRRLESRITQYQSYSSTSIARTRVQILQAKLNSLLALRSFQLQQATYYQKIQEEQDKILAVRRKNKDELVEKLMKSRRKILARDTVHETQDVSESGLMEASILQTPEDLWVEYGKATYYSDYFEGRNMASGSPFSNSKIDGVYYAAHKTAPFGAVFRVTNIVNGQTVVVIIGDRGPFVAFRIIDLPRDAFAEISPLSRGIIDVKIEEISQE